MLNHCILHYKLTSRWFSASGLDGGLGTSSFGTCQWFLGWRLLGRNFGGITLNFWLRIFRLTARPFFRRHQEQRLNECQWPRERRGRG